MQSADAPVYSPCMCTFREFVLELCDGAHKLVLRPVEGSEFLCERCVVLNPNLKQHSHSGLGTLCGVAYFEKRGAHTQLPLWLAALRTWWVDRGAGNECPCCGRPRDGVMRTVSVLPASHTPSGVSFSLHEGPPPGNLASLPFEA